MIVGHVLVEAYSVLTRLPRNQRVRPELALSALSAAFLDDPVVLAGAEIRELIQTLGRSGVAGGAAYDAVVAETARRHGLTLITLDERATTTYEAIGVDTVFLGR